MKMDRRIGILSILLQKGAGHRTVLTAPEMRTIPAGLRSLDSVSGTRHYAQLMECRTDVCALSEVFPMRTALRAGF